MARSRTEQIDDLFVTTYQKAEKRIRDNIFNPQQSALWALLRKKNGFVPQVGGDYIKFDVEKDYNDNLQAVGKGDTVNLQDFTHLEQVRYEWAYYDIPIVRYWHDDDQNAGMAQIHNFIQSKISNTQNAYRELMEAKLFGDNDGSSPQQLEGLQHLVSDSNTASRSVGEINQSTYSWWRHQVVDFDDYQATGSGDTGTTEDTDWLASGVSVMRSMKQNCLDKTDLIVTSQHMFNLMQDDLLTFFEWDGRLAADLGVPTNTPMFDGIPVMWSRQCTSRMYFLNLDEIKIYFRPSDFITMGPWMDIPNTPKSRLAHVTLVCQMVTSERRSQGVIINLPNS